MVKKIYIIIEHPITNIGKLINVLSFLHPNDFNFPFLLNKKFGFVYNKANINIIYKNILFCT